MRKTLVLATIIFGGFAIVSTDAIAAVVKKVDVDKVIKAFGFQPPQRGVCLAHVYQYDNNSFMVGDLTSFVTATILYRGSKFAAYYIMPAASEPLNAGTKTANDSHTHVALGPNATMQFQPRPSQIPYNLPQHENYRNGVERGIQVDANYMIAPIPTDVTLVCGSRLKKCPCVAW